MKCAHLIVLLTVALMSSSIAAAEISLPVRIVEDPKKDDTPSEFEKEGRDLDRQDLEAQKSVAASTKTIVYLTIVQSVLSIFGAAGLLVTLYYTRASTKAALQTAQSNRAWVLFSGIEHGIIEDHGLSTGERVNRGFYFVVTWKNMGQSPAVRVRMMIDKYVVHPNAPIPKFSAEPNEQSGALDIGPDIQIASSRIGISDETTAQLLSGGRVVILYCCVWYQDIYRVDRFSECCFKVSISGTNTMNGNTTPNFIYTPEGKQNSST